MENVLKMEFSALAENEAFARAAATAFVMPLDPTVEEVTEIKTAVSEAVSNCVIHGYGELCTDESFAKNESPTIVMECALEKGNRLTIKIEDKGVGIDDIDQAMEPLFTTGDDEERSGMGFTVMQSFMDRLKVRSVKGEGTTVIMTKYLDVPDGI